MNCPRCCTEFDGDGVDIGEQVVCEECALLCGWGKCDECDEWFPTLHTCGRLDLCGDCADDDGYAGCSGCGDWFKKDQMGVRFGNCYCNDCAESNGLAVCDRCGELCDDLADCGGNFYCEHCQGCEGWDRCTDCRQMVDGAMEGADGYSYCPTCWGEHFCVCEECNRVIRQSRAIHQDGNILCQNCRPETWEPDSFDPTTNSYDRIGKRCFGVEIEVYHNPKHFTFKGKGAWGAKYDGSICSNDGREFYSDILCGDAGLEEVEKLCGFAHDNNWEVAETCGLHVHFDMREENTGGLKAIAVAMLSTYDVWLDFVHPDRWDRHYCHASEPDLISSIVTTDDFNELLYSRPHDKRYEWCNFMAYRCHNTFEVRLHQGSIDGKQICNWIRAISLWMDWASDKSWKEVRNLLLCKSKEEKYDLMCKVWSDAGCSDLIEWFDSVKGVCV